MSTRNPLNSRYTDGGPSGQTRKSAASAKPKRKAGDTVYVSSSRSKKNSGFGKAMPEKTKEEKRIDREKARVENNAIYSAATVLMNNNPDYKRYKLIWWIILGAAIVMTVVSWVVQMQIQSLVWGLVSIGVAYVGIIGALILDFWKIRPIRKEARVKAASMTKKQLDAVLEKEVLKNQRKKLEKDLKKAGKNADALSDEDADKVKALDDAQKKAQERSDQAFGTAQDAHKQTSKKPEEPKKDMSRINSYRRGSTKK